MPFIGGTQGGFITPGGGGGGGAGPPGPPGTAATLNVGSTTTGAPGTNALVTQVGTPQARIFDFTIPRGDQGAPGTGGGGTVTSVTAGTGITTTPAGGITGIGSVALANTAVTPGSYTLSSITVDAQGRLTAASSGTAGGTGTVTSVTAGTGLATTPTTGIVGTGSVALATVSGLTAGTYERVTVDAYGRVTTGTNPGFGTVASVTAGTGITTTPAGGITGTGSVALANTAVVPGSYTLASITVDAQGRLTAASSGTAGGTGTVTEVTAGAGLATSPLTGIVGTGSIALAASGVTPATYQGLTVDTYGRVTAASNQNYLTANQGITLSGDASGTGATAIAVTLPTVNSNVGTFNNVTVNGKGLVTAASNQTYLTANQSITLSGDASGTGATAIAVTLPTVNSNVGTFNNVTVNGKGLVTAASNQTYLTANQNITLSSDVTGTGATAISATVARIQGRAVLNVAPNEGDVLTWNNTAQRWEPKAPNGGPALQAPVVTAGQTVNGTVGDPITAYQIQTTGGIPDSYAISSGSLPLNLSLTTGPGVNAGQITGIPAAAGSTTVQVTATNTAGTSPPVNLSVSIAAGLVAPVVTSGQSISGAEGDPITTYQIQTTGGAPATYTVSPALPSGLSLNAGPGVGAGQITGTPAAGTAAASPYTVGITATNAAGTSPSVNMTITIAAPTGSSAQVYIAPLASPPSAPHELGRAWLRSNQNTLVFWNGSGWQPTAGG